MPTNITPPSFILPAKRSPNDMTPETVQRNRRIAEAMLGQSIDTSPIGHWTQGAARVAQALMAGHQMHRADEAERAGQQGAYSKITAALMNGTPDMASSAELLSDPWLSEGQSRLAGAMFERSQPKYRTFNNKRGDVLRYDENNPEAAPQTIYTDPGAAHDPQWQYVQPQLDQWGNETQPGYWADVNAQEQPQAPGYQLPEAAGGANLPMLGNDAPRAPGYGQSTSPDMASLAQRWLPGVSPKVIMGNPDAQEFLISKATNPNDGRDFDTWDRERRKAGAGSVMIDQKGLSAEEESAGKERGTRMDLLESGKSISSLQQIQLAGKLLQNVDSGALAGMKGKAGNIFASLGLPVADLKYLGIDPDLVTTGPQIQALVNRQVVGMIGSGQFPAQNFSDTDRIFLEQILPSLANQPEANALITATTERLLQIEVQKRQAWAQARKQKTSYRDFEAQWNDKLQGLDLFGDIAKKAGVTPDPSSMSDDELLRQLGGQ